ncbi:hypothetical protein Q3G72_020767 [Acer saccharum]|nr:hypothetical protein Q3G72_020767 [Acer saccharum]
MFLDGKRKEEGGRRKKKEEEDVDVSHHNICFLSDSSDKELRFKGKSDNSNNKFVDTETEQSRLELTHRVTLLAEVASGFLFFFSLEPVVDF